MSQSDFKVHLNAIAPAVAELDRPKIEVGQKWRTRGGGDAEITSMDNHADFPVNRVIAGRAVCWGKNGLDFGDIGDSEDQEDDDDLVELIRDADGFTIWRGGEMPKEVYGAEVTVRHRDGDQYTEIAGTFFSETWSHCGSSGDIVAYKVVEAAEEFGKVENLRVVIEDVRTGSETVNAIAILEAAAGHMRDRAATYDKPEGERSMAQTVKVFEAYHGIKLTAAQGWHFMQILKDVRLFTREAYHADSAEDCVAFAALKAEARASEAA